MRKRAWQILGLAVIFIAGYLYITCVVRVGDGEFAVVNDRKTGEYFMLQKGTGFVWQGAFPARIVISRIKCRNSETSEVRVPIRALEDLKSEMYTVRVPVNLIYDIDPAKLAIDARTLGSDRNAPGAMLKKALEGYFQKEFSVFLYPFYNRAGLLQLQQVIVKRAMDGLTAYAARIGVRIVSFEVPGNITLPDERSYYEGVLFQRELQEIERNNKKGLIILKNNLEKEKYSHREYMDRLAEMARLIKSNPDILKYIYIDRLAGNVKVIISPDRSGMPFGLELGDKESANPKKGEIDNLR